MGKRCQACNYDAPIGPKGFELGCPRCGAPYLVDAADITQALQQPVATKAGPKWLGVFWALFGIACTVALVALIRVPAPAVDSPNVGSGPATRQQREPGWHTISTTRFGCQNRELLAKLQSIQESGDKPSFERAATAEIRRGQCAVLDGGTEVYVVDLAMLSGLAKIRRRGETAEFWISSSGLQ